MNISLLSITSFTVVLGAYSIYMILLDLPQILFILLFKTMSYVSKKIWQGYVVILILPSKKGSITVYRRPSHSTITSLLWPNFTKIYIALGKMKEWYLSILTFFTSAIAVIGLFCKRKFNVCRYESLPLISGFPLFWNKIFWNKMCQSWSKQTENKCIWALFRRLPLSTSVNIFISDLRFGLHMI